MIFNWEMISKKRRARRFHQVIDAYDVNKKFIYDSKLWSKICLDLVKLIGMKVLKRPEVVHGTKGNPGDTIVTIIDFSDIIIHTFDEDEQYVNGICIEVFSCKPFNYDKVYKFIRESLETDDKHLKRAVVRYNNLPRL